MIPYWVFIQCMLIHTTIGKFLNLKGAHSMSILSDERSSTSLTIKRVTLHNTNDYSDLHKINNPNTTKWLGLKGCGCMVRFSCITQGLWYLFHIPTTTNLKHKDIHQVSGHHTLTPNFHVDLHEVWTVSSYIYVTSIHPHLQPNMFNVQHQFQDSEG